MIYDENRSPVYDYCAIKRSGNDQFFLKFDAKYLIIRAGLLQTGAFSGIFTMNFFETEQSDQSTTK